MNLIKNECLLCREIHNLDEKIQALIDTRDLKINELIQLQKLEKIKEENNE